MADSVNRIVPPSVALDGAAQSGREGARKERGEARHRRNDRTEPPQSSVNVKANKTVPEADEEKTKGKNLDVSA